MSVDAAAAAPVSTTTTNQSLNISPSDFVTFEMIPSPSRSFEMTPSSSSSSGVVVSDQLAQLELYLTMEMKYRGSAQPAHSDHQVRF
jgi:hypothetical protein